MATPRQAASRDKSAQTLIRHHLSGLLFLSNLGLPKPAAQQIVDLIWLAATQRSFTQYLSKVGMDHPASEGTIGRVLDA